MTVLILIITILILVLIHELGHFLLAKKFGVKVLEFGFGIPPKVWGKVVGETLVSVNALPFGGFVRLLGEDEEVKDDSKRSFANKPVGQRIIIVVAGVVMNLLLAWVLFYGVLVSQDFKIQLPLITKHTFVGVNQTDEAVILIGQVSKDSPADKAGIKVSDRVMAFNGQVVDSAQDLINQTKDSAGKEIRLTLSNPDKTQARDVTLVPRENPPAGQGALGVGLDSTEITTLDYSSPLSKILAGPIHSWNMISYQADGFGQLFATSVKTHNLKPVAQNVSGPVGITSIIGSILQTGQFYVYLNFLAILSINLAVVNVLPFPGLDGGRLFFLIWEALTKKKAHPAFEKYAHTVGLVILIGLMILITISDVRKLIY